MSPGKLAAQASHAAVEAYRISDTQMVNAWLSGLHYTKVVLLAEDDQQITNIETYLKERGFKVAPIIDEGRTEIKPFSKTALGVAIVDKAEQHVTDTFSSFKTYKELPIPPAPQPVDLEIAYSTVGAFGHLTRAGHRALKAGL